MILSACCDISITQWYYVIQFAVLLTNQSGPNGDVISAHIHTKLILPLTAIEGPISECSLKLKK